MAAPIARKYQLSLATFQHITNLHELVIVYTRTRAHDLTSCLQFLTNLKANKILSTHRFITQIQAYCLTLWGIFRCMGEEKWGKVSWEGYDG